MSSTKVVSRTLRTNTAVLKLADGQTIAGRRFIPVGKGDVVCADSGRLLVLAKEDCEWVPVGCGWVKQAKWEIAGSTFALTFKEIETAEELQLFDALRKFHYRGGGGAGRTVPLIAVTDTWDLPRVLGFIELSSCMIANTARKRFFDYPYWEESGVSWREWDRPATKRYSSLIARISRFVIHPELRGLGLARMFLEAAEEFARERWHFGGYRPRFLEITADMLRFYPFVGTEFVYLGDTEGNEHRLSKDMQYLVKKALSSDGPKGMPQGGGGIMTLQRGYAAQLIRYMEEHKRSLREVVESLRFDPARLDQDAWEALYRLNRRPKPCYVAGLTTEAKEYLARRARMMSPPPLGRRPKQKAETFKFTDVSVSARVRMSQSSEARTLQDAFGFVGAELDSDLVHPTSFVLSAGTITLVCGASGSGKSMLGAAIGAIANRSIGRSTREPPGRDMAMEISGKLDRPARLVEAPSIVSEVSPLEQAGNVSLDRFVTVCAKCGLAEPQLFVRPSLTLSSGQRYRLQLALGFLADPDVLYVDNFCEPLDWYTTVAVCKGLRSLAAEEEVAVVVSTAAYDKVRDLLRPHQTILMRRGDNPIIEGDRTEL